MKQYISNSYEETQALAASLAQRLPLPAVIGYIGDLGAGKTAFTAGFVKGMGIDAQVSSPTFALCNEYIGNGCRACHYDMYRVETWDDLVTTGYFDALDSGATLLVEWSENIYHALPEDALIVRIQKTGENTRQITVMNKEEANRELDIID
ncbi:MAG: tRNA (adenosine(37)-N6)-threonylcarbamoyltransferase complex ATPase subunit type 1 TsaE [Eubacterium sp.]|nr:tRNA (adenosine(37)-N6)-threonylcarbamoyltransferase complex ATPase subunit type 1 TsaE [Eubacterium sp.]